MSGPRFSVVIPTRERADTLKYTLDTCLVQRFDNYEIVVCDNCSSSSTKKLVDGFKSDKIKYVRSDRPLAMSDNWELAVSKATGEYVIVIGDDDGLLLHSLGEIDCLLKELKVKALRWDRLYYSWPNILAKEAANRLDIPLSRGVRILKAREVIPEVANGQMAYTLLPMLYNSAIHQDLIALLREKTGRVFKASCPDIYSGFAFAYLAQSYASVGRPMSTNAGSAKSNGVASIYLKGDSPISKEFHSLNEEASIGYHPKIPNIPVISAAIADSFQRAKDALFPDDSDLSIMRKHFVIKCVQELRSGSEDEWRRNLQTIRESLLDDIELQQWFDARVINRSPIEQSSDRSSDWRKQFSYETVDASRFGVTDVFGVAEIYEKISSKMTNKFQWYMRFELLSLWIRMKKVAGASSREQKYVDDA